MGFIYKIFSPKIILSTDELRKNKDLVIFWGAKKFSLASPSRGGNRNFMRIVFLKSYFDKKAQKLRR